MPTHLIDSQLARFRTTPEKFILTSNFEMNLRITPEKLEESGMILGKDLWVRAHSKDTPLNDLEERLHR